VFGFPLAVPFDPSHHQTGTDTMSKLLLPGQQQQQRGGDIESGEKTPLLLGRRRGGNKTELLHNKELEVESIKEKAVAGIAGCGFLASLLSILFENNPSALLSGILGLVLAPYAVRRGNAVGLLLLRASLLVVDASMSYDLSETTRPNIRPISLFCRLFSNKRSRNAKVRMLIVSNCFILMKGAMLTLQDLFVAASCFFNRADICVPSVATNQCANGRGNPVYVE
jgi:hypothetical protein